MRLGIDSDDVYRTHVSSRVIHVSMAETDFWRLSHVSIVQCVVLMLKIFAKILLRCNNISRVRQYDIDIDIVLYYLYIVKAIK